MKSTLIRFTSSEYAESYRTGNLYLSSLWTFWDFTDGKLRYDDIIAGKVTEEDVKKAIEQDKNRRSDFSEGVVAQIRRDQLPWLTKQFDDHIIHDVRFRLSAYKYCNLMCFFRIDAEDGDQGFLDEENAALILQKRGEGVTAEGLRAMGSQEAQLLVESVIKKNPVLSMNKFHLIQLPAPSMDNFGDCVVVIKNEDEFKRRVMDAVKKMGGHLIMGDVRYHPLLDRVNSETMKQHSITVVSSNHTPDTNDFENKKWLTEDGSFCLDDIKNAKGILWRGVLDKYDVYGIQKEWRICWLPKERDYKAKTLQVGSLDDIIDIVKTEDIRDYLLNRYRGYLSGIIQGSRRDVCGTESYKDFKERMKRIDGLGDFVMELG